MCALQVMMGMSIRSEDEFVYASVVESVKGQSISILGSFDLIQVMRESFSPEIWYRLTLSAEQVSVCEQLHYSKWSHEANIHSIDEEYIAKYIVESVKPTLQSSTDQVNTPDIRSDSISTLDTEESSMDVCY